MIHPRHLTKSNLDITVDIHRYQKWPYLKAITFSKAHHFGYPAVSFRGCKKKLTREFSRLFGATEFLRGNRILRLILVVLQEPKTDPKIIDKGTGYLMKYLKSKDDLMYIATQAQF